MSSQHQRSLLPAAMQGDVALKQYSRVVIVLIICITVLIFTYLTREKLCEITFKDGVREVSALMAYESGK